MTDAEIDALPAGRELDSLVAIYALGLKVYGSGDDIHLDAREHDGALVPVPRYSTEIGAVWLVVEHLGKSEHRELRLRDFSGIALHSWIAGFPLPCHDGVLEIGPTVASGDTAPLAICRAALRAFKPR